MIFSFRERVEVLFVGGFDKVCGIVVNRGKFFFEWEVEQMVFKVFLYYLFCGKKCGRIV